MDELRPLELKEKVATFFFFLTVVLFASGVYLLATKGIVAFMVALVAAVTSFSISLALIGVFDKKNKRRR